jgi:D-glycero-D-manno-heptose 1,7-bisphosphate phosphatase
MKLVILDRDGVINEDSDAYIKSPEEWIPIPGSLEAISRLHQAGYRIVVATNQSGVARGLFDMETLHRIHERMGQAAARLGGAVEAVFFCPHGPNDDCSCRKPKPGLLLDIARRLKTELNGVWSVGDSLRDVQASLAAGARPALVRTGKGRRTLEAKGKALEGVPVFDDLAAFVEQLLASEEKRGTTEK